MELDILKKAGLTESQAKGYLALINIGPLTPAELADKTNESRTNGYAIADKLVSLGLARKVNQTKATIEAENPTKLRSFINSRQQQLKSVNDELTGILPTMLSKFRLTSDQPGVINIEGVEALKLVYDEIIAAKQDVLIFPSPYDRDNPEISSLIDEQIARQRKAGVKSLALVRDVVFDDMKKYEDGLLLVKKLPIGVSFDAQIMVFGNIVVSTVFRHGIVSTIITSPETAATLRSVFFTIWNAC